ncbi:MAG TPA: HAMP domain-containing sensor histidine kinase, partial [Rhodanobacteraceae bacterium]
DQYYRTAATRALTFEGNCLCRNELLSAHFAQTPVRGTRSFFVARFDSERIHYAYFCPQGSPDMHVGDSEEQAVKLATVTWHLAHESKRATPHPPLLVDQHDGANRIIMRPVVDDSDHVLGVAGVILDERLSREAMTDLGNTSLKAHYPNDAPELRVRIYGRQLTDHHLLTQPLSFVFTDWRLGIKDLCSSPEELGALSFKNNMMLGGGVMIVLFGAIGLAVQAASRQMKLSQMKSDFVSNVSHELRTPLASIRVFGEYMRLGRVTSDEKVREYGEYIEAESRRLTQLINNILDFSKIESAQKKYKMAEADIVELVYDTTCAFAMPLREKGYDISFTAPATCISPLTIDRDALAQVLMNLLDNAVKYSNGDKRVAVIVSGDETSVRIAVADHGIGIPAAEQKKIFEKFYRVGSGLVHNVKGSGLGLAIVAHVVKAHGGRVEVASAPGEGSTFTIVLPKGAATPIETPKTNETEAA